ncbi:hypothetical protein [Pseudoalteromonas sp. OOF1S-7]|uniref:hypothetical protein n=1 Tax=Pseudoalteromonas sp. OOF1S-7 TaxID=2917757 RepID=UPI001EF6E15C|nr:hypothetical protein [Pseudoalteromonas sp. OOF1S-7]MCG7533915.1 hypothetical protein [Pseudoalteromonas sp. OOF1S-7]
MLIKQMLSLTEKPAGGYADQATMHKGNNAAIVTTSTAHVPATPSRLINATQAKLLGLPSPERKAKQVFLAMLASDK